MAGSHSNGHPPAFLLSKSVPTHSDDEDRARRLKRLMLIADGLRSAAALSPNDPELQARVNAAGTACQQLVAYLRRQEPVAVCPTGEFPQLRLAQIERLTAERRDALATMRALAGTSNMDAFTAACKTEAELAVRIRQLRAEVSRGN